MDVLISRQLAIDVLKAIKYGLWEIDIPSPTVPEYVEHHEQIKNMMEIVDEWIKRINEEPAINAVPVIRCKDCKWWHKEMSDDGKIEYINYSFCEKKHQGDGHEWYCPDGEGREE